MTQRQIDPRGPEAEETLARYIQSKLDMGRAEDRKQIVLLKRQMEGLEQEKAALLHELAGLEGQLRQRENQLFFIKTLKAIVDGFVSEEGPGAFQRAGRKQHD